MPPASYLLERAQYAALANVIDDGTLSLHQLITLALNPVDIEVVELLGLVPGGGGSGTGGGGGGSGTTLADIVVSSNGDHTDDVTPVNGAVVVDNGDNTGTITAGGKITITPNSNGTATVSF